jgi:hypothetical protein
LVGIYQLVGEVLLGGILPHLDPCSSYYSGIAGAGLRLHPEELPEQDPMGLIPKKASQKCTKTAVWKIPLGLTLRY